MAAGMILDPSNIFFLILLILGVYGFVCLLFWEKIQPLIDELQSRLG